MGFFTPLNFHELFWICEIKFVKCCRNVIAILVAILIFLVKHMDCEILNVNIQFLNNLWRYTIMKITLYMVYTCVKSTSYQYIEYTHPCTTIYVYNLFSIVLHLSALRLLDRNCFMDESMSVLEGVLGIYYRLAEHICCACGYVIGVWCMYVEKLHIYILISMVTSVMFVYPW